jgi:hypothetical protein
LLAAAPLAQAQTTFGIKAGLNVANVTLDDDVEADFEQAGLELKPRLGLVAGVFADVALTPQLSFHPEVLFSQKGFTLSPESEDLDFTVTQQIDYVEVPLLLSYRFPIGQNGLGIGIEAGPTLAYKVSTGTSCDGEGDIEDLCDSFDDEENEDDGIRDYDFGGAVGLTVGAGPFGVGARFTQGLTTIDDTEGQADEPDANVRNRVFSLTANYSF